MLKKNLQNSFIEFCKKKKFEVNKNQLEIINAFQKFIIKKKIILNFFSQSQEKLCFYLQGNVGVGKTMLTNFVFDNLNIRKLKIHFNEFMVNFHDFRHQKKDQNSITSFVRNLKKKYEIIYLDEFQVTNIVDAMILGKLFQTLFKENMKIIITTNTKLSNLYKEGLQREQFLPFISIIKKRSIQKELLIHDDYRQQNINETKRVFYPINEKTTFMINKIFREFTKNIKKEEKIILTKGREIKISDFFNGIVKFKYEDLCKTTLGAEDYINISKICKHVFIEEIPNFNEYNSNEQLRFITLIDIFYEKQINLTLSIAADLDKINSSKKHSSIFKRTISRLFEMTRTTT